MHLPLRARGLLHTARRVAGATGAARSWLLSLGLLLLAGCESLGYYGQAALGQAELVVARRPVAAVIEDPENPAELRERLRTSREILAFARPVAGAAGGRSLSELGRSWSGTRWSGMSWPLRPIPSHPCSGAFPVTGCVAYRGYFREEAARNKARELAQRGLDVHVGAVAAYSTLGWFDDPLLDTFIHRGDAELAELLFHELAHGLLWVPSETAFNESFATFVGREGVRRWLTERGRREALERWESRRALQERFVDRALSMRSRIGQGYLLLRSAPEGRKEEWRKELRAHLWAVERARWRATRPPELSPWDGFMLAPPSNARLNAVADYHLHLPAFASLLAEVDGDWARFLARVRELAEGPPEARRAFLERR
ncbi:MAG: aminopeptidase [Gammaproteobacteria bacterium]|nr:aminopeptidase [Gammaproteobacteria bacterium]